MSKAMGFTTGRNNRDFSMDKYIDRMTQESDEFMEYKGYDITRDGDPTASNDLWSEEIKAWADMSTIESLFFSEDWVYILVDLMANKISSQPMYVVRKNLANGAESYEYADGHPLNKLLQNPNPYQDYYSWMYMTVTQFGLLGNAIQWYSKQMNWLVTMRTAMTSIEFNNDGSIKAYMYQSGSEDQPIRPGTGSIYLPSEIIHIRRPNPASLLWGLSPFIPGRKSLLFNRYSTDYLNSFYLKQATPGMILEMDRQVNESQALRQLRSFELAYTGRKNQRRTMILPKGVKATPSSHSIADQRIVELITMNRETIINLLRAPKQEFSLQTSGSLGSEEYKIALRNFWEATLTPATNLIAGALTKYFKPMLGEAFEFKFDLTNVEALKDDQMKKATTAKEMLAGGLSVNEVRTRVWDLEPAPGIENDMPYVSKPVTPPLVGGGLGNASEPPKNDSQGGSDQGVTLPLLEGVDQGGDPGESEEAKVIAPTDTEVLLSMISKRKADWTDLTIKSLEEEVAEKAGRKLYELAIETLVAMAEAAEPIIKNNLVEIKAAEMPSKKKLKKDLAKAFAKFEEEWVDEFTSTLSSTVDLGYNTQLDMIFNDKDREKIEALKARDSKNRRLILEERGLESFSSILKTHTERIMTAITNGVEEGETIQQISKRVADTFADPVAMKGKAETIARTETLTAASIGQGAAMKNAQEVIPGLKKGWLNAADARVRDSHLDKSKGGVSGEIVDANDTFSNGLRFPRDTRADDPGEVINCRCTLVLLPPED